MCEIVWIVICCIVNIFEVKCCSVFNYCFYMLYDVFWDILYHFMQLCTLYRFPWDPIDCWDVLIHSHTALIAPMSTMLRLPSIGLLVVVGICSGELCAMLHQGNTNMLELGVVDGCQNQPLLREVVLSSKTMGYIGISSYNIYIYSINLNIIIGISS